MRSREVIELLVEDGWFEVAVKGSHHQFKHPEKRGRVTAVSYTHLTLPTSDLV